MNDRRIHADVTAVNDLSFAAQPGRVTTSFVGPNGAASTVFELLNTYFLQYVLGSDPHCLTTLGLLARIPDLADRDVYLCGPRRMADAVRSAVLQAGLPADRLHEERFAF